MAWRRSTRPDGSPSTPTFCPGLRWHYAIGTAVVSQDGASRRPSGRWRTSRPLSGRLRANLLSGKRHGRSVPDRGNTAVISSGAAIYDYRGWLSGFVGWASGGGHLLTGFRNRILVVTHGCGGSPRSSCPSHRQRRSAEMTTAGGRPNHVYSW
jgi:hypothetical protein